MQSQVTLVVEMNEKTFPIGQVKYDFDADVEVTFNMEPGCPGDKVTTPPTPPQAHYQGYTINKVFLVKDGEDVYINRLADNICKVYHPGIHKIIENHIHSVMDDLQDQAIADYEIGMCD